jgi:hypothetical protein
LSPSSTGTAADELLRAAFDRTYRYPEGFPGFTARLRVADDGDALQDTTVELRAGAAPIVGGKVGTGEVAHELGMLAGHRWHRTYEEADGRWEKTLRADGNPLGDLVELDDPMRSSYRVRDGEITTITRHHGGLRFTIVVQERIATADGRSISRAFSAAYWDEATRGIVRADVFVDDYVVLDGLPLPASRRIARATDAGLRARTLGLSAHEVLR